MQLNYSFPVYTGTT